MKRALFFIIVVFLFACNSSKHTQKKKMGQYVQQPKHFDEDKAIRERISANKAAKKTKKNKYYKLGKTRIKGRKY